jgi:hypothetical protein
MWRDMSLGVCVCVCVQSLHFQDRAISLYSSKTVDKKEILCSVSNTGIYCWSDEVGTVFTKFQSQHRCSLQLVWGHGVLLVYTVYCEIVLPWKPFGKGHMYIYTFVLSRSVTGIALPFTHIFTWCEQYRVGPKSNAIYFFPPLLLVAARSGWLG